MKETFTHKLKFRGIAPAPLPCHDATIAALTTPTLCCCCMQEILIIRKCQRRLMKNIEKADIQNKYVQLLPILLYYYYYYYYYYS